MKILALIAMSCIALSIGACGDSTDATQPEASASSKSTRPPSGGPPKTRIVEVSGPGSKLKIRIPPGPPPKNLVVKELRAGSGPAVTNGKDEIVVNYVGVDYKTGDEFYNTWERGGPSKFLFEETHKGWELGLKGMRAGGIRKLITPPRLEYGTNTLVYVIELVKVRRAA